MTHNLVYSHTFWSILNLFDTFLYSVLSYSTSVVTFSDVTLYLGPWTYLVWGSRLPRSSSLPFLSRMGPGHPSSPLSIYLLISSPFRFSLSFIGFTYFLLLSIPSLSTRIAPLRFQAGGHRRRPNLCLVCVLFCQSWICQCQSWIWNRGCCFVLCVICIP